MKIEKNDMVMVYDGGGTVPHCKYTGRFGDLTAYWQEIVSDAVYLFRLGESEDEEGMVPDDATVAYISTLDGSREERAFELAKHDYYGFLDYKEDRYTTVYGYMD